MQLDIYGRHLTDFFLSLQEHLKTVGIYSQECVLKIANTKYLGKQGFPQK